MSKRCRACGETLSLDHFGPVKSRGILRATCTPCRRLKYAGMSSQVTAKNRERYAVDDEFRAKRKAQAITPNTDPIRRRKRIQTSHHKARGDALAAYGGKCECCGETEPRFLCIDHRYGDGAAHRAAIKTTIFFWLRKNGYPKDRFRLLCHNCNFASGTKGVCPHSAQAPIAGDTWQHMGYS